MMPPGRWFSHDEIEWHREELAHAEHRGRVAEARLVDCQRQLREARQHQSGLSALTQADQEEPY